MKRREAIKSIGMAASATAVVVTGLGSLSLDAKENKAVKDLKVILLNGSPRANGNTHRMLQEAAQRLESKGIIAEIVNLGTGPVRGCISCGQCMARRLGKCTFDDDICNTVIDKVEKADGLIVGSPVFYGTPNGQVLSLIQRMAFSASSKIQGKPVSVVTVCRRGGASAAFQTLQMPFQMLNMPIVTSQYWNIGYGMGPGEVEKDEEGIQTMRTLADNMAYMLKQFASGDEKEPERERQMMTNFIR